MRRRFLLLLDPAVVVLFVVIGRDTHDEAPGLAGIFETAAPFLIALAVGWAAARIWRRPLALDAGVIVAAVTLALGMLLRRLVFGEGTALAFVLVATGFLGLAMVGWRGLAARLSA